MANFSTILTINCVHTSNWFTHASVTNRTINGQNDYSVLTVYIYIYIQSTVED